MTGPDVEPRGAGRQPGRLGRASPAPEATTPGGRTRAEYRAYRRRQVAGLLRLLPTESVRSLYGRAREWAVSADVHEEKDPMATLRRYCERILPLPPFRVWLADRNANPDAHVGELDRDPPGGPGAGPSEPVTVDVRSLHRGEERWYAGLSVVADGSRWRGYITFRRGPDTPGHRTADVFREESVREVRARFRSFDESSLRAFLRSVLP